MDKTKVLYLNSAFTKELPKADEAIDSIFIEGYASTVDIDRSGDVVPTSVWEAGIKNYLKNPVVLAHHDHDDPIGRVIEHRIDAGGLWIKARISAAAEVFNLVKDGVITAFSIGFRILDAEYNSAAELFVIKELELIEISVVSVPCNQNTLFSLSKAFDSAEEYSKFKAQFSLSKGDSANGLDAPNGTESTIKKEWNMDPKEIQKMVEDAASAAAALATKTLLASQAEASEASLKAAKAAQAEQEALEAKVKAAVAAHISVGESGAEKLLAEVTKRMEDATAASTAAVDELKGALKEKNDELLAIQKSKMVFGKDGKAGDYAQRETAFLLSKISGKSIEATAFGDNLVKTGAHLPSATWELEVSTNMEAEVRRRLVVAPLIQAINMKTNVMTIPVNPEAGVATWITNAQFGTSASPGAAQTHLMKEITLNAYKVATMEYLAYEEEEDSLLVLLPIIRDAMIRRVARAMDSAYLLGAGAGADPVKGLATYDTTSVVLPAVGTGTTVANMRALRKDLGAHGLDPSEVTYVVSTEVYYDLLDDASFQTVDKVADRATLLTGQIGSIGNSPVLVSSAFPTKAAGTATATANIGAIAVNASNFLAGNQRGLRFDTQDLVETQRKVLVSSLRTGLTQKTTNLGIGVSVLRWAA